MDLRTNMDANTVIMATPQVLCCMCGLLIDSNPSNMCPSCIKAHVDITEGLIKEYIITHCPECKRYLQPPTYWTKAELESRELLTLCVKKIRGLAKYHVVDVSFIWTEPHSKRIKLKLVLQREIFTNTVIQQTTQIDYVVQWKQCELCGKEATGQPQWDAVVQLRQKVIHRRTFMFLEQMILKHHMHDNVIRIESHPDGLDFYFNHKSQGLHFVDFVGTLSPVTRTDAVQLVSHDSKTNTAVQHHAYSLEICPVCREDLVVLPRKVANQMGGIGPMVIVLKVFSSLVFMDPRSLRASEMQGSLYWKNDFESLATTRQMVEFFVIDITPTGVNNGKFQQGEAQICLSSEIGGDREWVILTHLGGVLNAGDLAMGYFVEGINFNNSDIGDYESSALQDVLLVHKHFPNQAARRHRRKWKLRRLDVIDPAGNTAKATIEAQRKDFEEFQDDIERDKEFRGGLHLFHDKQAQQLAQARKEARAERQAQHGGALGQTEDDEDDEAVVDVEELLDELKIQHNDVQEMVKAAVEAEGETFEDEDSEVLTVEQARAKRERE